MKRKSIKQSIIRLLKYLISDNTIQTLGAATGILGATLLALNIGMSLIAYVLFITSSVLWGVFAYKTNNKQLLTMNIVFSSINLMGIYNYS